MKTARYGILVRLPFLFLIVILLAMGVFGKRGIKDLTRIKKNNTELSQMIQRATDEKDALMKRIQGLKENPLEQERMIRQVLGYVRSNETVLEF